jgi:hypothetical protein
MLRPLLDRSAALAVAAFLASATLVSPAAHAVLTLSLDDGGGPTIVTDDDGDGFVTFNGALTDFDINVSTGLSQPRLTGSPTIIDLNSVNSSLNGGLLTLELSDTGFTAPTAYLNFGIGGTTDGLLTYEAFVNQSNGDPFAGALIGSGSADGDAAFSDINRLLLNLDGTAPYSLGIRVTIAHEVGSKVSSFDAGIRVPEPGTLGLLGAGLALAGLALRRRRQSA